MHATPVRLRPILALLLVLVGLVWLGQGLGVIPGSFMTGDLLWAWLGGGLLLVAALVALWPTLRRR